MGLSGSGKTSLAKLLAPMFNAVLINEDEVRKEANDFDLSEVGRSIHTNRMKRLADEAIQNNRNVVADIECPEDFNADYIICMDTLKESKYEDTNKMFEQPKNFDFKVPHKDATMWAYLIKQDINDKME